MKNEYGNGLPMIYIACIEPQLPIMAEMSKKVKGNPKWEHYELKTGHDAMITAPKELSELLGQIVAKH